MPKISIIVPVYNVEEYIHRCIDSILAQTITDFELILVNDGSTDRSGEICDKYALEDERVKVIHKSNGGPGEARNYGINISKGDFIGFVDSDDYVDSKMYEELYNANLIYDSQISMCGRYDVYKDYKKSRFILDELQVWNNKLAIKKLLTWDNIDSSVCDKLFSKSIIDNNQFPVGGEVEDIYLVYKLLFNARHIVHIGEPKYYYVHREGSRSAKNFNESKLDLLKYSEKIVEFVKSNFPELTSEAESFYYKNLVYLADNLNASQDTEKYSKISFRLRKILRANFFDIISNRYLTKRDVIKSILICLNLDSLINLIRRIKHIFS